MQDSTDRQRVTILYYERRAVSKKRFWKLGSKEREREIGVVLEETWKNTEQRKEGEIIVAEKI